MLSRAASNCSRFATASRCAMTMMRAELPSRVSIKCWAASVLLSRSFQPEGYSNERPSFAKRSTGGCDSDDCAAALARHGAGAHVREIKSETKSVFFIFLVLRRDGEV